MKKIEAIIKPFKLDEVKEALQELGVQHFVFAGHRETTDFLQFQEFSVRNTTRTSSAFAALLLAPTQI